MAPRYFSGIGNCSVSETIINCIGLFGNYENKDCAVLLMPFVMSFKTKIPGFFTNLFPFISSPKSLLKGKEISEHVKHGLVVLAPNKTLIK